MKGTNLQSTGFTLLYVSTEFLTIGSNERSALFATLNLHVTRENSN